MSLYLEENQDIPLKKALEVMLERILTQSTYFGIETLKNPLDFWVYQEMLFQLKPDVIVEIGNNCGGSTLALAHLCDLFNHGRVIGIDINHDRVPDLVKNHPRITLIEGDACACLGKVKSLISETESVVVIEDSSHTYDNTLAVLRAYSPLIKPGSYFIVEDSICHHGIEVGPNPGPYEAIETFVNINPDFEIDRSKESFFITYNLKGFLKRINPNS